MRRLRNARVVSDPGKTVINSGAYTDVSNPSGYVISMGGKRGDRGWNHVLAHEMGHVASGHIATLSGMPKAVLKSLILREKGTVAREVEAWDFANRTKGKKDPELKRAALASYRELADFQSKASTVMGYSYPAAMIGGLGYLAANGVIDIVGIAKNKKAAAAIGGVVALSAAGVSALIHSQSRRERIDSAAGLDIADRSEATKKSWITRRQKYGKSGERR
jgi:hypothetical protein